MGAERNVLPSITDTDVINTGGEWVSSLDLENCAMSHPQVREGKERRTGAVGDGLAVKFMAHRKIASRLPKPEDILDGKVKDLEIKEVSAMYTLTTSLCYELKDRAEKSAKGWDTMADRFFEYMMANFPTELVVMGAKTALSNYNLPLDATKMKSFDAFHKKYGKYVLSAMEN